MRHRTARWSFALLLVLAPAGVIAQRAAPAGAHPTPRPARANASPARLAVVGPTTAGLRPRGRTFVLTGAALGAVAGAALFGPRLDDAEIGPALAYGLPAAAGAAVGAGAGYVVFRVRHRSRPPATGRRAAR